MPPSSCPVSGTPPVWVGRPPLNMQSPVAADHTELLQTPCRIDWSSSLKKKGPVASSQHAVLDTFYSEGRSPQLTMVIVSHCWGSAKMSWLSSSARNTVPLKWHQTKGRATAGHLQNGTVTATWARLSFPFILKLIFADGNEVQAWDTVHSQTRSPQLLWQL